MDTLMSRTSTKETCKTRTVLSVMFGMDSNNLPNDLVYCCSFLVCIDLDN